MDYNKIKNLAKEDRETTEIEMIMQCQMIKARTDTSAAIFVRDTLGAKPVDETKMDASVHNPYESLTDEELELIANARKQKELEKVENIVVAEGVTDGQTDSQGQD